MGHYTLTMTSEDANRLEAHAAALGITPAQLFANAVNTYIALKKYNKVYIEIITQGPHDDQPKRSLKLLEVP